MSDYGKKKEWLERFKQALIESETDRDVEGAMVNIGFSACPVGLQLVEYYEACEALGVAAVGNDGMLPQWQRFEAARKALNED